MAASCDTVIVTTTLKGFRVTSGHIYESSILPPQTGCPRLSQKWERASLAPPSLAPPCLRSASCLQPQATDQSPCPFPAGSPSSQLLHAGPLPAVSEGRSGNSLVSDFPPLACPDKKRLLAGGRHASQTVEAAGSQKPLHFLTFSQLLCVFEPLGLCELSPSAPRKGSSLSESPAALVCDTGLKFMNLCALS